MEVLAGVSWPAKMIVNASGGARAMRRGA